jgi:phosphoenolpyruvate carboxykinase (ATP)
MTNRTLALLPVQPAKIHWNDTPSRLYEEALRRGEGHVVEGGPLAVLTGKHTGRSANDKYIVHQANTQDSIAWGKVNQPMTEEAFDGLRDRLFTDLAAREVYVQDLYAGANPDYRLRVRVITEYAWHALFARNLFIVPPTAEREDFTPDFTVIDIPGFTADPLVDHTNSEVFIALNLAQRLVLIGGTQYAGEIKKSIFTVLNTLLPRQGVLPMHCSANIGPDGDTAVFFGLSGTGKTTLSADSTRTLIGDDEHGWDDTGVFNFEGGCYAKVIRLSPTAEPEIYRTTRTFGTVLENVVYDPDTGCIDLDSARHTENTRAAYDIAQIPNAAPDGRGGHPQNIVMLTADAFGVLPPISRLSAEQAMYHFLSGYTAKVAGTEKGVTEPSATFSTCFGAPFMSLHPTVYAQLLGQKIAQHNVRVWLVNTGWIGGAYGTGHRIQIAYTRAMIQAALGGLLDNVEYRTHPIFGLQMPVTCPNVPDEVLDPRRLWADPAAYDAAALRLANMFEENFRKYADFVTDAVKDAGMLHLLPQV